MIESPKAPQLPEDSKPKGKAGYKPPVTRTGDLVEHYQKGILRTRNIVGLLAALAGGTFAASGVLGASVKRSELESAIGNLRVELQRHEDRPHTETLTELRALTEKLQRLSWQLSENIRQVQSMTEELDRTRKLVEDQRKLIKSERGTDFFNELEKWWKGKGRKKR